jgi:hypothetical protein
MKARECMVYESIHTPMWPSAGILGTAPASILSVVQGRG